MIRRALLAREGAARNSSAAGSADAPAAARRPNLGTAGDYWVSQGGWRSGHMKGEGFSRISPQSPCPPLRHDPGAGTQWYTFGRRRQYCQLSSVRSTVR
eukprot:2164736-Pyramimonas_sp.AAC.1